MGQSFPLAQGIDCPPSPGVLFPNRAVLGRSHLVLLLPRQPGAYVDFMVIMEMIKKFTDREVFIADPHNVKLWFDKFNPDILR